MLHPMVVRSLGTVRHKVTIGIPTWEIACHILAVRARVRVVPVPTVTTMMTTFIARMKIA